MNSKPHSHLLPLLPKSKKAPKSRTVVADVLIALLPLLIFGIYKFGGLAFIQTAVAVISAVLFEFLYTLIFKKENSASDGTSVITGVLISFILPVGIPLYMVLIASFTAVIFMKEVFNGRGNNPLNPALTGWLVLFLFFRKALQTYPPVKTSSDVFGAATPLDNLLKPQVTTGYHLKDLFSLFIGDKNGALGEISAILIIASFIYLLFRQVITPHITLSFLGTAFLVAFFLPETGFARFNFVYAFMHLFSGNLLLAAVFFANDYTTTPKTRKGKLLFGVFLGIATMFIRYYFAVEGALFSILLGNLAVYFLNKTDFIKPYTYNTTSKSKIKEIPRND